MSVNAYQLLLDAQARLAEHRPDPSPATAIRVTDHAEQGRPGREGDEFWVHPVDWRNLLTATDQRGQFVVTVGGVSGREALDRLSGLPIVWGPPAGSEEGKP